MFDYEAEQQLLRLARFGIHRHFDSESEQQFMEEIIPSLKQELACFVTLKIETALRGCIGNMEPHSSLYATVLRNAHSAAFHDPRFNPLTEQELSDINISISVLNKPQALPFANEIDLLSKLKKNIDGLVIEKDNKRATFLPAVWESIQQPEQFLNQLKLKAGMELSDSPDRAYIYQTISISE